MIHLFLASETILICFHFLLHSKVILDTAACLQQRKLTLRVNFQITPLKHDVSWILELQDKTTIQEAYHKFINSLAQDRYIAQNYRKV